MKTGFTQQIAEKLHLSAKQVGNIEQLHSEGATIPFISRYRKEATGNLDEVEIGRVVEQIKYFDELDKRKETVLKTIEAAGKLTPLLKTRIEGCFDATELEDLYLPFKPKRKTRASMAMEKGLEPLAAILFAQQIPDPEAAAIPFVRDPVKDIREALQGASDIMAEWIAEHEDARHAIRTLFRETAMLESRILPGKKEAEDAKKYQDYFEFSERLSQSPSHRILAIRRGEKEGWLAMDISISREAAIEALEKIFIKANHASSALLKTSIADSYDRLLKSSIETEFRVQSKNRADEEAIRVFAENLRQLLMASPLGAKRVMAIDPGFRTGCKLVCLDEQGNFLHYETIFPHAPQNETSQSGRTIRELVSKYQVEAIGIGNGTAGRETEQFIRQLDFSHPLSVFMVNENGASIYSASETAREEFPDQDLTVRGAISIGRRLLDPLSELVKIDPKSIGVGQYQHDVNPTKLKEELDRTVESCVNHVGVDLNTASRHLLVYVSGLTASLAKNIVQYRTEHGAFASREELRKISGMGPKSFEQCAGFLRIRDAENPLDNSAVHPESYGVVQAMASDLKCSVRDLIGQAELRKKIRRQNYVTGNTGEFTIEDILKELEKPGRDPRGTATEFRFEESIHTLEDVKAGMVLPGIVTNITNFGAFVDIGVKQDGLVHISALSNHFIKDPNEVVKLQQQVMVTVIEVDVKRKRIALSMKEPSKKPRSGPGVLKEAKRPVGKEEPGDSFESKLALLKKKFK